LPEKVSVLLPGYRAFGSQIWQERRRLFQRLLAAAEIAQENRENPRDAELRYELLRIGYAYGQLE
jgi:hypothetical protein